MMNFKTFHQKYIIFLQSSFYHHYGALILKLNVLSIQGTLGHNSMGLESNILSSRCITTQIDVLPSWCDRISIYRLILKYFSLCASGLNLMSYPFGAMKLESTVLLLTNDITNRSTTCLSLRVFQNNKKYSNSHY